VVAAGAAIGNGHGTAARQIVSDGAALIQPQTQLIPLALAEPEVQPRPLEAASARQSETFLAGRMGEERADFTFRYNSDGSVRETVVYFYGPDLRAAAAGSGDPLRREAVYLGQVDPVRLHAARKVSDTYYVGPPGHERRDLRREYHPDGRVARTVIFFYEGDRRAADAPSGTAVRRQIAYEGYAD
jgi:hypothetical protein